MRLGERTDMSGDEVRVRHNIAPNEILIDITQVQWEYARGNARDDREPRRCQFGGYASATE